MSYKRKISNYLLMPHVQFKYLYYLMAMVAAPISVLLTYVVSELVNLQTRLISLGISEEAMHLFEGANFRVVVGFVICFFSVLIVAFICLLLVSHRFVGPMYVVNQFIKEMQTGKYATSRELRKDDELKETLDLLKELGKKIQRIEKASGE